MALFDEFRDGAERFRVEVDALKALLKQHGVNGPRALVDLHRNNATFRTEWNAIWTRLGKDNRGKVSLATAGAILGASFGGMGIVALGGAIGVPLLAVLGIGGLLAGTEVDAAIRKGDFIKVELPKSVYDRLSRKAHSLGEEPRDLLAKLVETALQGSDDPGADT